MRVPSLSLYNSSTHRLGGLTSDLKDANDVVASQKRINNLCDDPIGISQVLDLNMTIGNLDQLDRNINMGKTWLNGTESALDSMQDQLLDIKVLASQLVNAGVSESERESGAEQVQKAIDQIFALCNTQVNGNYIFGGTQSDIRPFAFDDKDNPTQVIYGGGDSPFSVKIGPDHSLDVGLVGGEVVTESQIRVDGTNNKIFFSENPGDINNSKRVMEASIPQGVYSPKELAILARNAMNKASTDHGYGIKYDVEYDGASQTFCFTNDGTHEGYMETQLLWQAGEIPRIDGIEGEGILDGSIEISIEDENALVHNTPDPPGSSPLELTYQGNGKWKVHNDPGYGIPDEITGTDALIELDLNHNELTDLRINLESPAIPGDSIRFDINEPSDDHSLGPDMGFKGNMTIGAPRGQSALTLKTIDHTNNVIDFNENVGGTISTLTAAIPPGEYKDMDELAAAVESSMEGASANGIDYSVQYNKDTRRFTISGAGSTLTELQLLWNSGTYQATKGAGAALGFDTTADDIGAVSHESDTDVALFSIQAGINDAIDFKEVLPGGTLGGTDELTARIPAGDYTSVESFLSAIEDALEDVSAEKGNRVDYDVSYSYINHKISIKEDGHNGQKLDSFHLLWGSGENASETAAAAMGFDEVDLSQAPSKGESETWGIFETLFDLKDYLQSNNVAGIERSMTRLDTHYQSITSEISNIGVKTNRILVSQQVSAESKLSIKDRRSTIEDADVVESIMNLTAVQTAYEASLSTTSKILNMSLVDFL